MKFREFGRTGWEVSEIGLGAWAIGAEWGEVTEEDALAAIHTSIEKGINFIDTADVYGDGRSERLVSKAIKEHRERIYVATKAGRRLERQYPEGYNRQNLTAFVERSLKNLQTETLDLLQLHCPPTQVYFMPEVFQILDDLVTAGKLLFYGVSVEKIEEALKAIEYPGVQSVQIIFNIFRQRPVEQFFKLARQRKVGILARVPLASGLLTGKMTSTSSFPKNDHRNYNLHGESFDVGETFSGIDFETGLKAVDQLRPLVPEGASMAQFALRWILMHDAVSLAIPGAKNARQAADNADASLMSALPENTMARIVQIYDELIRDQVHHRW